MAIFNSLGSNYNFNSVSKTFKAANNADNLHRLKRYLEKKYGGEAMLVYKGREAIRLALRASGVTKGSVAVCGYTCFAVYEAIVTEDLDVVFLDIDDSLNFSAVTLQEALKNNPEIKVLMIQNTLGYTTDITQIVKLCRSKGILIIEDAAHCVGAKYPTGQEVGTVGDVTIFSFSQDKMIDGVSGGALVIRNKKYHVPQVDLPDIDAKRQRVDRLYPLFTTLIRKTYASGFGKLLHTLLRKTNMLSKPMDSADNELHGLAAWYSDLIYQDFLRLDENLVHRRKIVRIYAKTLNKKVLLKPIAVTINQSANLRFPIVIEKREKLITHLKSKNLHLSDIWYDAPIGPKKYLIRTDYNGQCPNAEVISEKIINLPTHSNVTEKDAHSIAAEINTWLP